MPVVPFEKVSRDKTVFRLVKHTAELFPPDAEKPLPSAFALSADDKREGVDRGRQALLSVWDLTLTTVEEGKQLRNVDAEMTAFGLLVDDIEAIQVDDFSMDVLHDPLPPELGPGANGHCGIQGLDKPKGTPKAFFKQLRFLLVESCFKIGG